MDPVTDPKRRKTTAETRTCPEKKEPNRSQIRESFNLSNLYSILIKLIIVSTAKSCNGRDKNCLRRQKHTRITLNIHIRINVLECLT